MYTKRLWLHEELMVYRVINILFSETVVFIVMSLRPILLLAFVHSRTEEVTEEIP